MENNDNKIDIVSYMISAVRTFFRLKFVAVAAVIFGAISVVLYSQFSYSPVYEVSTSFTVKLINPLYSSVSGYNSQTAEQMEKTFPYILSSNALKSAVKEQLGVDSLPYVSASVTKGTNVFTLKVSGSDPEYIYKVLETVIDCYPDVAEYVIGPTQMILIKEATVPTYPINSVNYVRAVVVGGGGGFVIVAAVSLLIAILQNTVTDEDSLKRLLNVPCLGSVPAVKKVGKNKRPLITDVDHNQGFAEALNIARVRLERELETRNKKVLLVSSALPGEGKTTFAVNLAMSMAQKGKRILIVDCDLRNPSATEIMGLKGVPGLAEYLEKKLPMQAVIKNSGTKNLFVIGAGSASDENTVELFAKSDFRVLTESCKGVFDLIILDTPPCGVLCDASDIAGAAECAVMVVRNDYASKGRIVEGASVLSDNKLDIVGCVINGSKRHDGYGYYGYYSYGRYGYSNRRYGKE